MPVVRDAVLTERRALAGAYLRLAFAHPEVAAGARAGQFVMLKSPLSSEPLLPRPFSVLETDPGRGTFAIFLKVVGPGSRAIAALREGDAAACLGPLGRPFSDPPPEAEALMVAGGYGIAPFLLFSRRLAARRGRGRVFYGGRTGVDLQLREPFAELEVPLVPATEDGSLGHRGRVTEPLAEYLAQARGPVRVYACGPDAMLHAVAGVAEEAGVPAEVSLDPWMGCGVGTCLGCVVRIQNATEEKAHHRCACTEGPVFDARLVVWPGEPASRARGDAVRARS
jgi:dihydroorotate dehydrogenase electron transfer subunit